MRVMAGFYGTQEPKTEVVNARLLALNANVTEGELMQTLAEGVGCAWHEEWTLDGVHTSQELTPIYQKAFRLKRPRA